jgi:arylsulfatase A-like enzyme
MTGPRSLLLITVDCLRADHVGFLGYDRPTTPFLDSLAAEGVVFSNAIVAGAPTYYSFPAILASRHPLALGRDVLGLAPGEPTIATVLKESGYVTAAFLAGNPYLSRRFGYHAGFATFRDFLDAEIESTAVPGNGAGSRGLLTRLNRGLAEVCHKVGSLGSLYDELYFQYCQRVAASPAPSFDMLRRYPAADVIVDHACDWLAGVGDVPFFLWLHLMDPHSPYYPPPDALRLMGRGDISAGRARYLNSYWNRGDLGANRLGRHREDVIALYDAGIRWVDAQVARLVDTLRHSRLWDNCVFAFTADHGEEFLDHGGRYHPPSRVTEELVRVPLLLRMPGVNQTGPVQAPFSMIHLAPTLLEAAGAPVPDSFSGRAYGSRWHSAEGDGDAAIVECISDCANLFRADGRLGRRIIAVREQRYKLVFDFGLPQELVFDLADDPGELHPLSADAEKPERRRLLERLRRHLSDSQKDGGAERRLRALLQEIRLESAATAACESSLVNTQG